MTNQRVTRIYTRTGDQGITSLSDGSRIAKDHARIVALGEVDELNCALGVLLSWDLPELLNAPLTKIQHELFELGNELALPGKVVISEKHTLRLEQNIEHLNLNLPPLREFILPRGNPAATACHLSRAVCRRAERSLVVLSRNDAVNPLALRYLNRLSDFLFVMARLINHLNAHSDVTWQIKPARGS